MIYLDNAATTLEKPPAVPRAVTCAMTHCASPGRGGYRAAERAAEILFQCREEAAKMFDVQNPECVILTQNATHGLNVAIRSLVKQGAKVVISGYEHNAVTRPLHNISNVQLRVVDTPVFDQDESVRRFAEAVTDEVDVVICNHVSNVFGYIQPIDRIAEICRKKRKPLIIDASQSAGIIPVSMRGLGASFIAMPGHKGLYGPQGTGLLLCGEIPDPIIFGGTGSSSMVQAMPEFLPDRLEAGTPNVCGAAGLLAGMRFVSERGVQNIGCHERCLCRKMAEMLREIPAVRVFDGENQSGVISFMVEGVDCETVAEKLSGQGIAVRSGLHCAPLAHQTVGTLESGTIRASFSAFSTKQQVERAVYAIRKIAG